MYVSYTADEINTIRKSWKLILNWGKGRADLFQELETARIGDSKKSGTINAHLAVVQVLHDALVNWNKPIEPARLCMRAPLCRLYTVISWWALDRIREGTAYPDDEPSVKALMPVLDRVIKLRDDHNTRIVSDTVDDIAAL